MPGQMDGQSDSSISISKGNTFTIRSSDGTAVYTGEAVYDARFVFFSSAAITSGETYTLTSGGTELATATAGGQGEGEGNGCEGCFHFLFLLCGATVAPCVYGRPTAAGQL